MSDSPNDPRESLTRKDLVLKDQVTAVALRYVPGLFVYGSGGVGKSYTVLNHLKALDVPFQLFNSRMTGKGLFMAIGGAPDAVFVLEDMERLTKDADAQGVLRSALWSQPGHERVVTWTTATNGKESFVFRGGIIMISNRPLADMPELKALATRIEVNRLDVSEVELETRMRDIAAVGVVSDGATILDPTVCLEVTEYLLAECRRAGCPLDLRLQQKAFQIFRQWDALHSKCHWHDLLAASVSEAATHFKHEADMKPREDRQAELRDVYRAVRLIAKSAKDQEEEYRKRTGTSRADFYRRKREVESGEFEPERD